MATSSVEKTVTLVQQQINMSVTPKKYVSLIGAKEINQLSTPQSTGSSNSNASFNVNVPNTENVVLDRSSVQISIPLTITMAGSAGDGTNGNIYQPDYECFKANTIHRMMKGLGIQAASSKMNYEPYKLINAMECFCNDESNYEYMNTMIDMACDYAQYNGMVNSPFAQRFDSWKISRNASCPITVVSNTYNAAVLTTTLVASLSQYEPFTYEKHSSGGIFDPLKIDISYIDNLTSIWARSSAHPQNTLTSLTITVGQGTLYTTYLTLPDFVVHPPETLLYPYFDTNATICQTTPNITAGSTFSASTGNQTLNFMPSRVYFFATVSDSERLSNLTNQTQIPNFFSEIVNVAVNWNNSPVMYSTATQADLFNIAKRNGMSKEYTYPDFVGAYGTANTANQPLRGSIICFQPAVDFGCSTNGLQSQVGVAGKQTLQITATMKNQTLATHSWDIHLILVYDGIMEVQRGKNSVNQLAVITPSNTLSYEIYKDVVPHLEAGGDAKTFFKGLWTKMQPILKTINEGLKETKLISKIAPAIPGVRAVTPIIKKLGYGEGGVMPPYPMCYPRRLGYGEGEGMYAYGDGEGDGEGEGEGGARRRKSSAYLKRRTARGGLLSY